MDRSFRPMRHAGPSRRVWMQVPFFGMDGLV